MPINSLDQTLIKGNPHLRHKVKPHNTCLINLLQSLVLPIHNIITTHFTSSCIQSIIGIMIRNSAAIITMEPFAFLYLYDFWMPVKNMNSRLTKQSTRPNHCNTHNLSFVLTFANLKTRVRKRLAKKSVYGNLLVFGT